MGIMGISDKGLQGSPVCQHDLFLGKNLDNTNRL